MDLLSLSFIYGLFWGGWVVVQVPAPVLILKKILLYSSEYWLFFSKKAIHDDTVIHPLDGRRLLEKEEGEPELLFLGDWYISTELSQSTGLANNSIISIKFFSISFPEILKVIAKHSMKYTSQIFFHYHI